MSLSGPALRLGAMNRLSLEASPYLRQHAENPVDWYPWGDEAFAAALERDRPVFLSIGYSACHWCHVMAHESFEDPATAALLNELFVNVKVDREERPDVDAVYMEAVQAMTGSGGWPLSAFITPDGRPFFTGTYFPSSAGHGRPSFTEVCRAVDDAWTNRRDELLEQADSITEHLRASSLTGGGDLPDATVLVSARDTLVSQHDRAFGGFGNAPKFPQTMSLEVLLRHHHRTGDAEALTVVTDTLDHMAAGGINDHLAGGFSRYSVDRRWLVPHFEKMLYDQALIARVYLHSWQTTASAHHRRVLDDIVGYVLTELRHRGGGFFAAEDADSEGVEGKFYVWSLAEINDVLGTDALEAIQWWGVTEQGNFEGANILNRLHAPSDHDEPAVVSAARERLVEARSKRVRPGLDDKVLTEWNGLMIATLAEAGAATHTAAWIDAAVDAAQHLLDNHRGPQGRWLRSWQDDDGGGTARHQALAVDHASVLDAFIRLAEATGQQRWISEAIDVADRMLELFWDDADGGLFTTGHDGEQLVSRAKDLLDNATPSANSLAAVALLRLAALTGSDHYRQRAESIVALLAGIAAQHPTALGHLLGAVDLIANGIQEIVIVGDAPELVDAVHERHLPGAVLAWGEPYDSPLWDGRRDGLAYVCEHFTCQAPVSDVKALLAHLCR